MQSPYGFNPIFNPIQHLLAFSISFLIYHVLQKCWISSLHIVLPVSNARNEDFVREAELLRERPKASEYSKNLLKSILDSK